MQEFVWQRASVLTKTNKNCGIDRPENFPITVYLSGYVIWCDMKNSFS